MDVFDTHRGERRDESVIDAQCGNGKRSQKRAEISIRRRNRDWIAGKTGECPGRTDGGRDSNASGEAQGCEFILDALSEGELRAEEVRHAADVEKEGVGLSIELERIGIDSDRGGIARAPFGEFAERFAVASGVEGFDDCIGSDRAGVGERHSGANAAGNGEWTAASNELRIGACGDEQKRRRERRVIRRNVFGAGAAPQFLLS